MFRVVMLMFAIIENDFVLYCTPVECENRSYRTAATPNKLFIFAEVDSTRQTVGLRSLKNGRQGGQARFRHQIFVVSCQIAMFKRSLSSLDLAPPLGTPQPGSSPPPSAGGNAYPFPAQTANHSQLDKAALTRSTTSFSSLLIALSELAEIEGRKAKSEKKLAKCLKEVATSWDSSNFRVPATLLVASELVKGLATVDAVHAVSIQGKYEALNSSVADYFKRVAVSLSLISICYSYRC